MSVVLKDKDRFLLLKRYGLVERTIKLVQSGMEYVGALCHTPSYYARNLNKFPTWEECDKVKELYLEPDELKKIVDGNLNEAELAKECSNKKIDSYEKKINGMLDFKKKAGFNV